jgi:MGT family glycosyltransferase
VGDWTPPAGDDPLVLVGMSSTFMDQADVLQRITTALGELPVRGLVTTGPAIPVESIDAPPNVTLVERAPHSEVLRHAGAVVSHAGHGTVMKALAAGVPVVALPLGRDQLDNAARVAHHGAGLRLKAKASPETIAGAVRRVLDEPAFGENARRLAAAIAEETAQDLAVEELEELAAAKGSDPVVASTAA